MYPHSWEASQQRQTFLQKRLDELDQRSVFLQEMFQTWKDFHQLSMPREECRAFFVYLQRESLHFRQAHQQFRQDLLQERDRWLRENKLSMGPDTNDLNRKKAAK